MIEKEKLVNIVGEHNVNYEQNVLDEYSKDISFVNSIRPLCVVKPNSGEDIQKIVNLANQTLTPLIPVSSGPPHFRGDTIPSIGGAVIVDLGNMKKILNVDRARRVAMVEPGVTFGELIPEAAKEGIRLNTPLLPRKSKSVVGSLLEREPVTMPKYHWDTSDPVACFGVIFGSGKEYRTGQAAGPGNIKEQWEAGAMQKAPWGPGIGSWHRLIQGAQGTMGIVTWASMRCEILPSLEESFVVGNSKLDELLEFTAWLIRLRMVNECFILNNTNLAAIFARNWPCDYQMIKASLPTWTLFYNIAGYKYCPEERVSVNIKDITNLAQRLGLGVKVTKAVGDISANSILKAVRQPCEDPYWKLRYKGACEDLFFLTINDKIANLIEIMNQITDKTGYPVPDLGVYLQPVVQGTGMHCEFNMFYDPDNQIEVNRVKQLSTQAVKKLMNNGAFFSRPYGESSEMILNRDAATVDLLKKLKKMFDPNNILNPGKICF